MRLNIWLDAKNVGRMHSLIGNQYSAKLNTANTVFCIFEPDAKGMTANSFPTESSVFFGSRVGGLYPYCISRTNDDNKPDRGRKGRTAFIKKRRKKDLGEETVDPALIERILWEGDNAHTAAGLAKVMNDLAARYPTKESAKASLPLLPLRTDLKQAINLSTVDSRGVLAIVVPSGGEDTLSSTVAPLLFEEGIAGRMHIARLTDKEFAVAKAEGLVIGGTQTTGLFFMYPEMFGRNAEVKAEIPFTANEAGIRGSLTTALAEFRKVWRKKDYETHLREGITAGINWAEWSPSDEEIATRVPRDSAVEKYLTKKDEVKAEKKAGTDTAKP